MFAIRDWTLSLNFGQLYRLESDEFGLLLTGADMETALEKARYIYARFRESLNISKNGENRQIFCAVSMGVISSRTVHSSSDILNVIERILRIASEQEDIAIYDEDMDRLLTRCLEIEISLKSCVKNGMQGFSIHYQPMDRLLFRCGYEEQNPVAE